MKKGLFESYVARGIQPYEIQNEISKIEVSKKENLWLFMNIFGGLYNDSFTFASNFMIKKTFSNQKNPRLHTKEFWCQVNLLPHTLNPLFSPPLRLRYLGVGVKKFSDEISFETLSNKYDQPYFLLAFTMSLCISSTNTNIDARN